MSSVVWVELKIGSRLALTFSAFLRVLCSLLPNHEINEAQMVAIFQTGWGGL